MLLAWTTTALLEGSAVMTLFCLFSLCYFKPHILDFIQSYKNSCNVSS